MMEGRRRRIDDICDGALARSGNDREAFVSAACGGDPALREEVDALLAHAGAAHMFLSTPLAAVAADVLGATVDTSLVGRRFGSYEITAVLGAGGMGQVYRARDLKLGRDVAFKVLRSSLAQDPDGRARLAREARLLASINHPHIATVYGLEDADGVPALVMEVVNGPTLADTLTATAKRRLAVPQALAIGVQLADALEAAHAAGIIHRDLKPANIKVDRNGHVKVLDFGLAKAISPGGADQFDTHPPSDPRRTVTGVISGTPAYMSPEQARGQDIDKRTDVWAFGCVMFEMLTGRAAFRRDTLSDTIAAVLNEEPDWTLIRDQAPAVRSLLRRCLAKDPRRRLRDIGDARMELEDGLAANAIESSDVPSHSHRKRSIAIAIATGVALVVGLATARAFRSPTATAEPETRTEIVTPPTREAASFAISPDGRQIAFVASGDDGVSRLWVRPLNGEMSQPLANTDGAQYPFWSPDSRSVGFSTGRVLKRIDVGTGITQVVTSIEKPGPSRVNGAAWSIDGVILFARTGNDGGLFRIPAEGGDAVAVVTGDPAPRWPSFLSDGRRFLFYRPAQHAGDGPGAIYLASLDGTAPARVTPSEGSGVYLPDGWLLWVRAGTQRLVAQRLDLLKAALVGEPVMVADGVASDWNTGPAPVSASNNGLLAYRRTEGNRRQLMWFDRDGKARGTVGDADSSNMQWPRISPDGHRVAVSRTVQGNQDLWLLDGPRMTRFTFDPAADLRPVWSPDGSQIVFGSTRSGSGSDLYEKPTNGTGSEKRLASSPLGKFPTNWSSDGRFVLYFAVGGDGSTDTWLMPMAREGADTPSIYLDTPFRASWAVFSPDGRWVAYESNESGRDEIYAQRFVAPGTTGPPPDRLPVSVGGGIYPLWAANGKEIYYLNPEGAMMATPVTATAPMLTLSTPVRLFSTRIYGGGVDQGHGREYDVSRDGRFLIDAEVNDSSPITLLQNWNPNAK